jgi:tetratricopeptide (TPR) repeat protein
MTETATTPPADIDKNRLVAGVEAALGAGDMTRATGLALTAVEAGVEHPMMLSLAGYGLWLNDRPAEATILLFRAQRQAPRDPNVLHLLALCLGASGRTTEAVEAYETTLRAAPDFAPARFNLGALKQELGELDAARELYESAIALDPNYAQALALLADLDAKAGRLDAARALAERALAIDTAQFPAVSALTAADLASGRAEEALSRLRAVLAEGRLSPLNAAIARNLEGDALDVLDRPAEAFAAYADSKARFHDMYLPRFGDRESALTHARRLAPAFEATPAEAWTSPQPTPAARADAPRTHVFLLGFPRSGTTLLEQVLAAHPDVTSLEEMDTLLDSWMSYVSPPPGLGQLAQAGEAELENMRQAYWTRVANAGGRPAGRVFVDKMPINTLQLPVIARLFPQAKVLFARRDPRDVVLSCFRRRFGMNDFMFQFTTLEGAAAYYDAVMALAAAYVARLPLNLHLVRYERLVEDFEREARAVCGFLGLDWTDDLHRFAEKAQGRAINTPSSAQVARGLYREGAGQWRRYREDLASVLPVLAPWVELYGYPAD